MFSILQALVNLFFLNMNSYCVLIEVPSCRMTPLVWQVSSSKPEFWLLVRSQYYKEHNYNNVGYLESVPIKRLACKA